MIIRRYSDADAIRWDQFVEDSKNGTFLFFRGYMDYHQDRFTDHSLILENEKHQIIALIPANEWKHEAQGKVLYSHQGLTYGGLILSNRTSVADVLQIFDLVISYLRENHFCHWYYKQIPTIYHRIPSQEDEYALWRNNASIAACLISATIPLDYEHSHTPAKAHRRRGRAHALQLGYQIKETSDIEQFWPIMVQNLALKYGAKPVHSSEEMMKLMNAFPDNIKCFLALKDNVPQAGAIVYIANKQTVHLQYCHATEQGKKDRVIDLLYTYLTDLFKEQGFHYFDLGTSNEEGGKILNESLISHKESFGARGVAYKTYYLDIN